jgi:hypothetical protein
LTRLTEKAGITADQATKALDTIKDFVKEKFPMMAGAVDNLFGAAPEATDTVGATAAIPDPAAPVIASDSILDKISDVIPGEAGQKVEGFIKDAAEKAGDVFDDVKDKLNDARHGETGQKVEGFVKDAAEKAEEVFGDLKNKVQGFFDGDKK